MPLGPPQIIRRFPFAVLALSGNDAVDFLQRISTNDFTAFREGSVQKTLLVSDKGRIIDAVWVVNHTGQLLMLASEGSAAEVQHFLERYIIMDDVSIQDVSAQYTCDLNFLEHNSGYRTDYFGHAVSISVQESAPQSQQQHVHTGNEFEQWRIENGIPTAKKEIVQDFNPLELNLWDWISFTKGCYIGQEVIARLDTYQKIQRCLCYCTADRPFSDGDLLTDADGADVGRITSALSTENGQIGLCLIRMKYANELNRLTVKEKGIEITIQRVFKKGN
jgi:folate-binding protein YgfZ